MLFYEEFFVFKPHFFQEKIAASSISRPVGDTGRHQPLFAEEVFGKKIKSRSEEDIAESDLEND